MRSPLRMVFALSLALATVQSASAQEELEKLLTESIDDGRKLINAYVSPFMNSVSLGMNQGWYNTAKAHKIGGIDLTITANAMTIPQSELFFDVSKLGLEVLELESSSPFHPLTPTVFGPTDKPTFSYTR